MLLDVDDGEVGAAVEDHVDGGGEPLGRELAGPIDVVAEADLVAGVGVPDAAGQELHARAAGAERVRDDGAVLEDLVAVQAQVGQVGRCEGRRHRDVGDLAVAAVERHADRLVEGATVEPDQEVGVHRVGEFGDAAVFEALAVDVVIKAAVHDPWLVDGEGKLEAAEPVEGGQLVGQAGVVAAVAQAQEPGAQLLDGDVLVAQVEEEVLAGQAGAAGESLAFAFVAGVVHGDLHDFSDLDRDVERVAARAVGIDAEELTRHAVAVGAADAVPAEVTKAELVAGIAVGRLGGRVVQAQQVAAGAVADPADIAGLPAGAARGDPGLGGMDAGRAVDGPFVVGIAGVVDLTERGGGVVGRRHEQHG
ncbi:hypothetical protein SCOR_35905 [Sulfidibacter corallicola]